MGSNRFKQVQTGSNRVKQGQTGSNRVKQGQTMVKLGLTVSNGVKQVHTRSNGLKYGHNVPNSHGKKINIIFTFTFSFVGERWGNVGGVALKNFHSH